MEEMFAIVIECDTTMNTTKTWHAELFTWFAFSTSIELSLENKFIIFNPKQQLI